MEDSPTEEGSIANKHLHTNSKYMQMVLTKINCKRKFRLELFEAISDCDDGKELNVIFKMYRIDDDQLFYIYTRIHSSLKRELARIGEYTIEPFESVANGLSLKKNEMDLEIYCSTSQSDRHTICNLSKVLENSKHFSKVVLLEIDPIIKCFHRDTKFSVRIRICGTYDDHHSIEFINQLKQADNRITELMMFLKIWFKTFHIYCYECMSKHCLMTLIIFYLQNTNPPILVSMKIIKENAQTSILNGINFGLNSRKISINPSQNIHQLIKGFFEFYNSLDFEKVIIAPYLGRAINKADFQNKVLKYPEYEAQIRMISASSGESAKQLEIHHPVCVQDMYYLNRNIAKQESHKFLSKLDCKYIKECISMAHKKCCEPKLSIKNLYKSLLVDIIEELNQQFKLDDALTFYIFPRTTELQSLAKLAHQPASNLKKLWIKAYIAAIPQIITAVYKIDITLLPPVGNCELKQIEETKELPLPFKWSINSSMDLWTGREMKESGATFMDSLLAETETLYAERKQSLKFAVQLKGFITITIAKDFNSLRIAMNSHDSVLLSRNKDLRTFFKAFRSCMTSYNLKYRIHLLEKHLQTNIYY